MRAVFAALALAGAFHVAADAAPPTRVAQMSRDVVDALRKQRVESRHPCAPCGCIKGEGTR